MTVNPPRIMTPQPAACEAPCLSLVPGSVLRTTYTRDDHAHRWLRARVQGSVGPSHVHPPTLGTSASRSAQGPPWLAHPHEHRGEVIRAGDEGPALEHSRCELALVVKLDAPTVAARGGQDLSSRERSPPGLQIRDL